MTASPAGGGHLPSLDGLRALAAGLVVLTHAAYLTGFVTHGGLLGRLFGRGDLGVAVFFALSGYLLHRSLLAEQTSGGLRLRRYAARRVARIVPAFWLTLLVVVVAADPPLRTWLLNAFGLQIYVRDGSIPQLSQVWSIATEVSFYAVLPLAVVGLGVLRRRDARWPLRVLLAVVVVGVLAAWAASSGRVGQDVLYERWLPAHVGNFAVGMLLAEAELRPRDPVARRLGDLAARPGTCLALAGGAYLLATTPAAGRLTLGVVAGLQLAVKMALSCLVAGGLLLPLVLGGPNPVRAALSHDVVRWLGVVSYGIFLWHLPVFSALYAVTGVVPFTGGIVPLLVFGVPVTIGLAAASWYLLEGPALRLTARRWQGRAAVPLTRPS